MSKNEKQPVFVNHMGAPYPFGGRVYILPPLSLNEAEQTISKADSLKDMKPSEVFDFMSQTVHQSIIKNYPDITLDQVRNEFLNSWNFRDVYELVLNKSGIVGEPTDEEIDLGKYREIKAQTKNLSD